MKKTMIIMPVLMAFTLTGCSLLKNIFNKGDSSNSGSDSQQTTDSGSQSGSQSQGGGAQAGDVVIKPSTLGITADVTTAANYSQGGINVSFPEGIKVNTTYDEFGFAPNATVTFKVASGTLKIKKIVFDNYRYYNDCPMYAGESASGDGIVGSATGEDANKHNFVTWNSLDNAAYTYKSTYTGGNSWTYSFTITLG